MAIGKSATLLRRGPKKLAARAIIQLSDLKGTNLGMWRRQRYGGISNRSFLTYLYQELVQGETLTPEQIALLRRHFTNQQLFVLCEGGLFGRRWKDNYKISGMPFEWKDYYASIRYEQLNASYFPIIRLAKRLGMYVHLLCTTPQNYSHYVTELLQFHKIQELFDDVDFKADARLSSEAWLTRMYYRRCGLADGNSYILSETWHINSSAKDWRYV